MSDWLEKLERSVETAVAKRQVPSGVKTLASLMLQERDNPGLSEAQILDAVHEDPVFYAGVSLIASQIAQTDIYAVQNGERNDGHDVAQRLRNPNEFHSKFSFLWLVSAYLLSIGTCYIYRMEGGAILPVPPTKVTHEGGTDYQVVLGDRVLDATLDDNLVKIILPNLREPYISGSGYGAALADEIDIADAARKHESSTLHNNARPDIIVNAEGVSGDDIRMMGEKWERKHQGTNNSGKPAIMNAKNLTVETLNTSFSDLGFIQLREHSADTIRRVFSIPPELMGKVSSSNRATISAAFFVFAKVTLEPKLRQILDALNKKLIPLITTDRDVLFEAESVVPEDKDRVMTAMQNHPSAFTVNEMRKLQGFDPIAGGDVALSETPESFETQTDTPQAEDDHRVIRDFPLLNGGVPDSEYIDQIHSKLLDTNHA